MTLEAATQTEQGATAARQAQGESNPVLDPGAVGAAAHPSNPIPTPEDPIPAEPGASDPVDTAMLEQLVDIGGATSSDSATARADAKHDPAPDNDARMEDCAVQTMSVDAPAAAAPAPLGGDLPSGTQGLSAAMASLPGAGGPEMAAKVERLQHVRPP